MLVIFACITLDSEFRLSVTVAFRKAIPNSILLMFPMMLPWAREGPPVQERKGMKEKKKAPWLILWETEKPEALPMWVFLLILLH